MSRTSPVLGLVFVFLTLPAPAQNPAETVIRDNVQKYVAAVKAGDADAAAALYKPDGTHANGFGVTRRGRREIAEDIEKQLAGYARGSKPMRPAVSSSQFIHSFHVCARRRSSAK